MIDSSIEEIKNARKHVVITGTGRAGTTFLVQLLTDLGLETGFTKDDFNLSKEARAGLELDIRDDKCPYVVKNPWFMDYVDEVVKREDIVIEHIFLPMRDLDAAAKSRSFVDKNTRASLDILRRLFKPSSNIDGGLWHTRRKSKQADILARKFHDFLFSLTETNIPVTFLRYPKLINEPEYLYKKLLPILGSISQEDFNSSFERTVRPDLVHSFTQKDK